MAGNDSKHVLSIIEFLMRGFPVIKNAKKVNVVPSNRPTDRVTDKLIELHTRENDLRGPQFSIRYWQISITLGSGIAGFHCMLERVGSSSDPLAKLQKL